MAVKLCNVCGIRRPKTGSKGTETSPHNDMCNYCFEEGGMENQHSDHNHDAIKEIVEHAGDAQLSEHDKAELDFMSTCWFCHPELNLAQQGKKHQDQKNSSVAGFTRRPQLNHKGHSHPGTPAARRECKKAFWAEMAKSGITPENVTESAFVGWDAKLDGFGKPLADMVQVPGTNVLASTTIPGKITLVATGPKGGIVKQLKAAKPAKGIVTLGKNDYSPSKVSRSK